MFNRVNIVAMICLVIFWFAAKDARQFEGPSYAKYNDSQKNQKAQGK